MGVLTPGHAPAQKAPWWTAVDAKSVAVPDERLIVPDSFRTIAIDFENLEAALKSTPMESADRKGTVCAMDFPMPDGKTRTFSIVESPVMAPELSAKYPVIRTYAGMSINGAPATMRFDVTPLGFHAMIFTTEGTVFIDPYSRIHMGFHIVCFEKDLKWRPERGEFPKCGNTEVPGSGISGKPSGLSSTGGSSTTTINPVGEEKRTYRAAIAAAAEYTAHFSPSNPPDKIYGLSGIVTAMNRINAIYERELAIRLVLVANNDEIVYIDPVMDPYHCLSSGVSCDSRLLAENQRT